MLNESMQKKLLDKILNSKEFSHSKIYQQYLTYLVDAADRERPLKEITIAVEVFGKDASFNPAEDAIVRTHTYLLRKKLESYYFNEGKGDRYRLKIPKGHYETKFVPVKHNRFLSYTKRAKLTNRILAGICLLLTVLLVLSWTHGRNGWRAASFYPELEPGDPIWGEFLDGNRTVLVVIGNHFFFHEYSEQYRESLAVRHPMVNSIEDFEAMKPNVRPKVLPKPYSEPYFPFQAVWSLPPILNMLHSAHEQPVLRKSSDIGPQFLNEHDIIFVGSIKSLYRLRHVLVKSDFSYEIDPHRVIYSPPGGEDPEIIETAFHSDGPTEDLVLALKLPGPNQNSIFIIASFHSLGAPEIARYLTTPSMRNELDGLFLEQLNDIPPYFEILFRVSGIDKTAYNTDILVMNAVSSDEAAETE